MGAATTEGLQSGGVMATAKHFAGDGSTTFGTGRKADGLLDQGDAPLSALPAALQPYVTMINNAEAGAVMASYSSVDGIAMHENGWLLTNVRTREGWWRSVHFCCKGLCSQEHTWSNAACFACSICQSAAQSHCALQRHNRLPSPLLLPPPPPPPLSSLP
jgi:Glycosyl hydrolase family 3 N terminal domain